MKQFHEYPLAVATGKLLARRLRSLAPSELDFDLLAPIPKFWLKRLARGTNTSEILAEAISRELGVPLKNHVLRCRRPTRKQSLLGRLDRSRNAVGSLVLRRRTDLDGAHVLVVDDIMTTGATANEAARALKRGGAAKVTVAVIARASRKSARTPQPPDRPDSRRG